LKGRQAHEVKVAMTAASLALAERSAPRYTSYPTAPHFSASVGPETAAAWLEGLDPAATLSLYLHVPYCSAICAYCGCRAKAARRAAPLDDYADALAAEIALVASRAAARRVAHIHWGGGTPGLLGAGRLERLAETLETAFDLGAVAEHAIELDPRGVDAELARGLARIGVTRASLGVQDLNPHVQEAIGRVQPFATVARAADLLRAAGITAINLDLMYGLPHQTIDDLRRTAQFAVRLLPARLAIFGYAHVPWLKAHQRRIDEAALPGAAARLAQAQAAREILAAEGFEPIGLDHFAHRLDSMAIQARAGRLRRNFQGYTTDAADVLLPFGASAIGKLPEGYVQNAPDIGAWGRAIREGRLPAARGLALTDEDRCRGAAIERIMCDFAVDYGEIARDAMGDAAALDDCEAALDALAAQGVLTRRGRTATMTPIGRPFARLAAAAFDAYLPGQTARHSLAV
jgi:oxygen-independent coproporphyrinogen-3 oxidase